MSWLKSRWGPSGRELTRKKFVKTSPPNNMQMRLTTWVAVVSHWLFLPSRLVLKPLPICCPSGIVLQRMLQRTCMIPTFRFCDMGP